MLINQSGLESSIRDIKLLHSSTLDTQATGFEVATQQSVNTSVLTH
jgi:hypothetical protein